MNAGATFASNTWQAVAFPSIMDIVILLVIAIVSIVFLVLIHRTFFNKGRPRKYKNVTTMVVLGSGGHTMEMTKLIEQLDPQKYRPFHVIVARGDNLSKEKILGKFRAAECIIHEIGRSRQVGQSYITSVASTLLATFEALSIVLKNRPQLVLCNGPGTCLPICVVARILTNPVMIYVESFCRVESLSLTGKLLYFIVDHFLVQWPQLVTKYPRSKFRGLLV